MAADLDIEIIEEDLDDLSESIADDCDEDSRPAMELKDPNCPTSTSFMCSLLCMCNTCMGRVCVALIHVHLDVCILSLIKLPTVLIYHM